MPWTAADAPKKCKGDDRAKWASIANAILRDCIADGGTDKSCAPRAIRIANSKFSIGEVRMKKLSNVPKGALRLVDVGCHALAIGGEDDKPNELEMTVYSGGIIKDHFYWGDLAIDLTGLSFPKSRYPVLEEHDNDKKIAFTGKPSIDNGKLELNPKTTKFISTPESEEFQKLSAEGFPYQASMYAVPSSVEHVENGESIKVNELTFKGPGNIWRKTEFREASVCVFGWDTKAKASVFSKTETEDIDCEEFSSQPGDDAQDDINFKLEKGGDKKMDLKELEEKHPELVTTLTKRVTEEVTTTLQVKFDKDLKDEKDKFDKEKEGLETRLSASEEKTLNLEKKEDMRHEREQIILADKIWDTALAASQIAEHMYSKIRQHVSHAKFMKDGALDVEVFTKAVDEEIKDWEKDGVTTPVLGTGFSQRDVEGSEAKKALEMAKKDEDTTNTLLAHAGQKTEEKKE